MTKFTDGTRTVSIQMYEYNSGGNPTPDWEDSFYQVGSLPYDEEIGAYRVSSIYYLIEQAYEYKFGEGDHQDAFEGEPGHRSEDRIVRID